MEVSSEETGANRPPSSGKRVAVMNLDDRSQKRRGGQSKYDDSPGKRLERG